MESSSPTSTRPRRGAELELSIDSLAYGGAGVARTDGYVVFVRDAIPGDRVRALVTKSKRHYAEGHAVEALESESLKIVKLLSGPKTASVRDAYAFLEKTPLDYLGYILAESLNGKAVGKIRSYLNKWKPLRQALPGVATELEVLGLEHGPKFDKVIEDFFQLQLLGRARKLEDHGKVLRKLSGIKEPPKKIEEKKKPEKPKKKGSPGFSPENSATTDAASPKEAAPAARSASGKKPSHASESGHTKVKASLKSRQKTKSHGKKK